MLIEFWNIVVKVVSHYKYANTVENIRFFRFSKGGCLLHDDQRDYVFILAEVLLRRVE